jgi:chromosome segregation ATPase
VNRALHDQTTADFSKAQQRIDAHFDMIYTIITGGGVLRKSLTQASVFSDLVQGYFEKTNQVDGLRSKIVDLSTRNSELAQALKTNENFVDIFKSRIYQYEYENKEMREHPIRTMIHSWRSR